MTNATKTNNDNILILYTLILTVNKTAMKYKQTLLKSNLDAVYNVLILHKIKTLKLIILYLNRCWLYASAGKQHALKQRSIINQQILYNT